VRSDENFELILQEILEVSFCTRYVMAGETTRYIFDIVLSFSALGYNLMPILYIY